VAGRSLSSSPDIALVGFPAGLARSLYRFEHSVRGALSAGRRGNRECTARSIFGRLLLQRRDHIDYRLWPNVAGDALRQHCHDRRSNVRIDPSGGIRGRSARPVFPTDGPGHVQQGRRRRAL
jgi:hypothetical protein